MFYMANLIWYVVLNNKAAHDTRAVTKEKIIRKYMSHTYSYISAEKVYCGDMPFLSVYLRYRAELARVARFSCLRRKNLKKQELAK